MTPEQDKKSTAIRFGRRYGASPQARERMIIENSKLIWVGTCRYCRKTLKGGPIKLRNHVCEERADGK